MWSLGAGGGALARPVTRIGGAAEAIAAAVPNAGFLPRVNRAHESPGCGGGHERGEQDKGNERSERRRMLKSPREMQNGVPVQTNARTARLGGAHKKKGDHRPNSCGRCLDLFRLGKHGPLGLVAMVARDEAARGAAARGGTVVLI